MTKDQFIILKKELLAIVKNCNAKIAFRNKPRKLPSKFGDSGSYQSSNKTIHILSYGNTSYLSKLLVIAHEVRHAMHHHEGLYKEYYNPELDDGINYIKKLRSGEATLPSQELALDAENDCNKWAVEWIESHGIIIPREAASYKDFFQPYRPEHTLVYRIDRYFRHNEIIYKREILKTHLSHINPENQ